MKTYKLRNIEVSKQELQKLIKNNPELLEKNYKNWRAGHDRVYFSLSSNGEIYNRVEETLQEDSFRYETLNHFKTREQAEAYRDYLLAVGRVSRAIWEANEDWKDDWTSKDVKYSIFYDHTYKKMFWTINKKCQYLIVLPYIKSEEIVEQIIKDYEKDLMTIVNYKR